MKKIIEIEARLYNSGIGHDDIMNLIKQTVSSEMVCLHWSKEGYAPYVNTNFRFSEN